MLAAQPPGSDIELPMKVRTLSVPARFSALVMEVDSR